MRRSIPALCAVVILAVLATACEAGSSPREPDLAWVILVIGADGTGTVEVHPSAAHQDQLMGMGDDVGHALFPGHRLRVRIDGNAGGADFVKVRVLDLYRPGAHPSVELSTQSLGPVLIPYGIVRIEVELCPPDVDWSLLSKPSMPHPCEERTPILLNAQRLEFRLQMRPSSKDPWPPQILLWLGGLAVIAAFFSIRSASALRLRRLTVPLGIAAIVVMILALVISRLFAYPDDAGTSGRWSGWFLNFAQAAGAFAAFDFFAGFGVIGVALERLGRLKRREQSARVPARPDMPLPVS